MNVISRRHTLELRHVRESQVRKRYFAEASGATLETKRSKTLAIQKSLLNGGAPVPLWLFDTRTYVQHDPSRTASARSSRSSTRFRKSARARLSASTIDGEAEVVDRTLTSERKLVVASLNERVIAGGEVSTFV